MRSVLWRPLSSAGKWGTGGMATKLQAATIATAAGVRTGICSSENLHHIKLMLEGSVTVGTQVSLCRNPCRHPRTHMRAHSFP